MRVIAGKHKGRPLLRPPAVITRPTMDRVRESIFNILQHSEIDDEIFVIENTTVLDAFAGSGALGIEAISRGAKFAYFFDKSTRVLSTIRENIWSLGEAENTKIQKADATNPPKAPHPMDLVMLDPPFGKDLTSRCLKPLLKAGWINNQTLIMAEISSRELLNLPDGFRIIKEKEYGTAYIYFIKMCDNLPKQDMTAQNN